MVRTTFHCIRQYLATLAPWNTATNTMTWTGKTADGAFVIDDHWVSPDRLEWTLKRTNTHDEVVQTIEGVVTRVE